MPLAAYSQNNLKNCPMNEKYKNNVVVSRGIRNNNPANIKLSSDRWQGQIPPCDCKEKVFCCFYSIDFGIRALIVLLHNYIIKGYDTPRLIISRFAPSSENHTENYINYVCSYLCKDYFSYDDILNIDDVPIQYKSPEFFSLCRAICMYESEYKLSISRFNNILNFFKL